MTNHKNPPLDEARLADVLRGSAPSPAAFLAEYRRAIELDARQLLDAVGAGNLAQVEQLAHRIEGASKVIGAGPVAAASSVIAAAARSGDTAGLQPFLDVFVERKNALYVFIEALNPAGPGPAGPHAPSGSTPLCAGLIFLVVEDHEFQRGVIMRLLRQLGALEVHGFADGPAALVAARAIRGPAIVVLDLAMPTLNGMDVMRIAAEEQLPVSFIMNSALGEDLLRWPLQTARSYGGTVLGAVSKPLTAARLAPLLADHRHGKHLAPPRPSVQP